jgi:hypothetical protein
MPMPKKPGAGRLEVRCEPWFSDLIALAAAKTDRSVSGYVRHAVSEQLRRDGFSTEPPAGVPEEEPVRPVGRPRSTEEPASETSSKAKGKRSKSKKTEG